MAANTDVSEDRLEAVRQEIKALVLERERASGDDPDPKAVEEILKKIRVLADEGNHIARTLKSQRDARAADVATQSVADAAEVRADLEAQMAALKAQLEAPTAAPSDPQERVGEE